MPTYVFNDFMDECEKLNVGVDTDPKRDAAEQLRLYNDNDILRYVYLKRNIMTFVNTKVWDKLFKNTGQRVMIDGYHFIERQKLYYLAFVKNTAGKWRIKSLHLDDNELKPNNVFSGIDSKVITRNKG